MDNMELIKDIGLLYKSKIIIFGAGKKGKQLADFLDSEGICILLFCDNDCRKWNSEYTVGDKKYKIINPELLKDLIKKDDNIRVVVAIVNCLQVANQLKELGIYNAWDCFGIEMSFFLNRKSKYISIELQKKLDNEFAKLLHDSKMAPYIGQSAFINRVVKKKPSYLVYQPGKTGSSTIYKSIKEITDGVEHIHTLDYPEWCMHGEYRDEWIKWRDEYLNSQEEVAIITGVREPIIRDLSAYFQGYHEGVNRIYGMPNFVNDLQKSYECFVDMICNGVEYAYNIMGEYRDYVCINEFNWFDYEINRNFGIDIYEYPFDKELGYSIIEKENVRIFIYTMENINRAERALGIFLKREDFRLVNSNRSSHKKYYLTYCEAKEKIAIPKNYFEMYYDSNDMMRHFYSESDIERFKRKWIDKVVSASKT